MSLRGLLALTIAALVAACAPATSAEARLPLAPSGLQQVPLRVTAAKGLVRHFTVEIARTLPQQQVGLMNRATLAPDRGMIFPYNPPEAVAFWMKDTLIPLDMIFVRANGTIARIVTAVPLSLAPVPAGEPVGAVLEIGGGRAKALGIKSGDRVRW